MQIIEESPYGMWQNVYGCGLRVGTKLVGVKVFTVHENGIKTVNYISTAVDKRHKNIINHIDSTFKYIKSDCEDRFYLEFYSKEDFVKFLLLLEEWQNGI